MKKLYLNLITILLCSSCGTAKQNSKDISFWYDTPAKNRNEALPIGNGRMGTLIFGDTNYERIQFNENILYSGEPSTTFKEIKVTSEQKEEVVALFQKGEYLKAQDIACKNWPRRLHQLYQPFGDLHIKNNQKGEISHYRRDQYLSKATCHTSFELNGIKHQRQIFASYPDDLIVIHMDGNQKGRIDISLKIGSAHPTAQLMQKDGKLKYKKHVLYGDEIDDKGMYFEAQLLPELPVGGHIELKDNELRVYGTDEVCFLLSAATSFNEHYRLTANSAIAQVFPRCSYKATTMPSTCSPPLCFEKRNGHWLESQRQL